MKKTISLMLLAMAFCLGMVSCNNHQTLESAIKIANQQMPKSAGEGLTVERIAIEGNYVTYYVTASEDVDLDAIEENIDFVKPILLEQLKSGGDKETKAFFTLCKNENKGLAFKYMQDGRDVTIAIEPDEL